VTEAELQALIVEVAELHDWLVFHDNDSRRNVAGWPDLVCVKPPRVLFLELKSATGQIRPEQEVWMSALSKCDTIASGIVRPNQVDQVLDYLKRKDTKDD
jgi:hypothetical protein